MIPGEWYFWVSNRDVKSKSIFTWPYLFMFHPLMSCSTNTILGNATKILLSEGSYNSTYHTLICLLMMISMCLFSLSVFFVKTITVFSHSNYKWTKWVLPSALISFCDDFISLQPSILYCRDFLIKHRLRLMFCISCQRQHQALLQACRTIEV